VVLKLNNVHGGGLKGADFGHNVRMVKCLVIVGVLDKFHALEIAKRIKTVFAVVEYTGVGLQDLLCDGATTGGLKSDVD